MNVYEELREHLDKHATGAPSSPEIMEILSTLFTPEEAKVAAFTPFRPRPAALIAERAGVSEEEASERLEGLADKGLVYAREKDGQWGYALLPIMPGIFEFPYMKGVKDGTLVRLAELWDGYFSTHMKDMGEMPVPFARVVAIQEEVESEPRVLTYEKVYQLIDDAKVVGLSHCACRTAFANCDAPLEACMLFDDTCTYLVDRGFARYISKDEMKKLLREFDEMGLVHNVNNSQDRLQFICNCCPCCCGFLRAVVEFDAPGALATSGFLARVDENLCTGCAVCEERCPVGAIEVVNDLAVVDVKRCIGCALCATGCDTDAVEMARREELPRTPGTMPELGVEVLKARGKLEEFLEEVK
jgi:NAD-dependent dihydropyrimidine dehydrogenase PreA subunit/DNA-binding transcriptional ArsR family regulator